MPTTKRLLTDETGQSLVTAINNIVAAVKPNATEIQMSSSDTTTVATAITNINDKIGTVPSGQTVEGQITTLNSKFTSDLEGTKFMSLSFSSQLNLTVETNSRLIIITVGANSSRNSLYSAGTISSGTAYANPVITGSTISHSVGNNSISISTDGYTNALVIILVGSVTVN